MLARGLGVTAGKTRDSGPLDEKIRARRSATLMRMARPNMTVRKGRGYVVRFEASRA